MYRAPSATPASSPLPGLAELAAAPSISLSARAADLRALFVATGQTITDDLLRDIGFTPKILYGLAVASGLAIVTGLARLLPGTTPEMLLVFSFVLGTAYGVVRVVTWKIKWIDKRSQQDITIVMPMVVGFGYGLVAFGIEAALACIPFVPSAVSALLLAVGLGALWRAKYRPRHPGLGDRVPCVGLSRELFGVADPASLASVTWSHAAAATEPTTYRASAVRADGTEMTCAWQTQAGRTWLEITASFPAGFRWRHPTERVLLDGITLELAAGPKGPMVRATNTHAPATGRLLVQALSITLHACGAAAP